MVNDPKMDGRENQAESYHEMVVVDDVNFIDINVGWDQRHDDIYFYASQMTTGEGVIDPGLGDRAIRLTKRPEVAEQVFDYAVKEAESAENVRDFYLKVEAFIRTLQEEGGK